MPSKEINKKKIIKSGEFPEEFLDAVNDDLSLYVEKLENEKEKNLEKMKNAVSGLNEDELILIFLSPYN